MAKQQSLEAIGLPQPLDVPGQVFAAAWDPALAQLVVVSADPTDHANIVTRLSAPRPDRPPVVLHQARAAYDPSNRQRLIAVPDGSMLLVSSATRMVGLNGMYVVGVYTVQADATVREEAVIEQAAADSLVAVVTEADGRHYLVLQAVTPANNRLPIYVHALGVPGLPRVHEFHVPSAWLGHGYAIINVNGARQLFYACPDQRSQNFQLASFPTPLAAMAGGALDGIRPVREPASLKNAAGVNVTFGGDGLLLPRVGWTAQGQLKSIEVTRLDPVAAVIQHIGVWRYKPYLAANMAPVPAHVEFGPAFSVRRHPAVLTEIFQTNNRPYRSVVCHAWLETVPWATAWRDGLVPDEFRVRAHALAWLRWRAPREAATAEITSASPRDSLWAALPLEVFDYCVSYAWEEYLRPKVLQ